MRIGRHARRRLRRKAGTDREGPRSAHRMARTPRPHPPLRSRALSYGRRGDSVLPCRGTWKQARFRSGVAAGWPLSCGPASRAFLMLRCRNFAPPVANRSTAPACVQRAGPSSPSLHRPIASGSAFRSRSTADRACCPWKRSPIRRHITARGPPSATTTFRANSCTP